MRYVLPSVMLMVAGCGGESGVTGAISSMSPIEAQVAKFVRDNANDPGSVEFVRWGPNAKPGEWKAFMGGGYDPAYEIAGLPQPKNRPKSYITHDGHVVRLIYREKNDAGALQIKDAVFFIENDGRIRRVDNPHGDGWLAMRKLMNGDK